MMKEKGPSLRSRAGVTPPAMTPFAVLAHCANANKIVILSAAKDLYVFGNGVKAPRPLRRRSPLQRSEQVFT